MMTTQRQLIAAALAGDRGPMDRAELNWLRCHVVPHYADGSMPHSSEGNVCLWPEEIVRGGAPDGGLAVWWGWATPCRRCGRRVRIDPRCRFCSGAGHEDDIIEWWYLTDIDGLILEEER